MDLREEIYKPKRQSLIIQQISYMTPKVWNYKAQGKSMRLSVEREKKPKFGKRLLAPENGGFIDAFQIAGFTLPFAPFTLSPTCLLPFVFASNFDLFHSPPCSSFPLHFAFALPFAIFHSASLFPFLLLVSFTPCPRPEKGNGIYYYGIDNNDDNSGDLGGGNFGGDHFGSGNVGCCCAEMLVGAMYIKVESGVEWEKC